MLKKLLIIALLLGLAAGGYFGYVQSQTSAELKAAQEAKENEDWSRVRVHARRYLKTDPNNSDARLLMAEAVMKDVDLEFRQSVETAREMLNAIDDENASIARVREAEIVLINLKRIAESLELVDQALESQPIAAEAFQLKFRILCALSRYDDTESLFWNWFENLDESKRTEALRDWYYSQFSTSLFNITTDQFLGILAPSEAPIASTPYYRYRRCLEVEPDKPVLMSAMAAFHLRHQHSENAMKSIQSLIEDEEALTDMLLLNTLIEIYWTDGDFDNAVRYFEMWPESEKDSYRYFRMAGILAQEVDRDFEKALSFYEQAGTSWPGQIDSTIFFRSASCLQRVGRKEDANKKSEIGEKVKALLEPEILLENRKALNRLNESGSYEKLAKFYESFGRQKEADLWRAASDQRQQFDTIETK